jgi:hypothetical protein
MDSLDVLGMVCSFGSEPGEVVQAVVMSSMSRVIAARMRSGVPPPCVALFRHRCRRWPAFLVLLRCAVGSVFLRTVAATFRPSAADLSTQSLPKPLEVP